MNVNVLRLDHRLKRDTRITKEKGTISSWKM